MWKGQVQNDDDVVLWQTNLLYTECIGFILHHLLFLTMIFEVNVL